MAKDENAEIEPLPLEPMDDPEETQLAQPEPIELSEVDAQPAAKPKIQAFGAGAQPLGRAAEKQYKRPLNLTGCGATRCKIFHCKLTPGSMEHMEHQINEWLDEHEVEVKFCSHVVGVLEAKSSENNLIATLWF